MKGCNIISDSSCDLKALETREENIEFTTVPFIMQVGEKEFVDHEELDTAELIEAIAKSKEAAKSACPSPETWLEHFRRPGPAFALTISSNLSGSYQSACIARDMMLDEEPEKKIHIFDSKSTGPEIVLMIARLAELIRENIPFDQIVKDVQALADRTHVAFALCSFDNLVKNGRVSRLAGFVAGRLGLWGVGIASDEGRIVVKTKVRGAQKAIGAIIEDMKERAFTSGHVVISHCFNEEMAMKLKEKITQTWENAQVRIIPTRGLDSFYAEKGGLIIAY